MFLVSFKQDSTFHKYRFPTKMTEKGNVGEQLSSESLKLLHAEKIVGLIYFSDHEV